ncbi:MAG: hypothetical protein WD847_00050 [Pirellulales bacterium]
MWWALLLCLAVAANGSPAGECFEFRDEAEHGGRSLLVYRAVRLSADPVRLSYETAPGEGASYGSLPLGLPAGAPLPLAWKPSDDGGGQLWFDANGGGRISDRECHTLGSAELAVEAVVTVAADGKPRRHRRTILFRRSPLTGELRYAVRGYAVGHVTLGDARLPAILIDANSDGCFTAGDDRLLIDLDADGNFDPLGEQFPLGAPLAHGGAQYIVRCDPTASNVQVVPRSTATGTLRLTLGRVGSAVLPGSLSATFVSDVGELAAVHGLDQPLLVPDGVYRLTGLVFDLADSGGKTWSYRFGGDSGAVVEVRAGEQTSIDLLDGLALEARLSPDTPSAPGTEILVSPALRTPAGLYLAHCGIRADRRQPWEASARIELCDAAGERLSRALSSFG